MSATINSIPASAIVSVTPSVISGGGTGLDLIELMLTTNTRVPIGTVMSFPSLASVNSFFGATTNEALQSGVYFGGFDGSTKKPGAVLMAQYPTANVGAYLRGGNISGLTLTQLQALTGVLTITIDGTPTTSSTINLSGATSFSNAAQSITTALALSGPTQATVTAAMGASFTGSGSSTNLTVTSVTGTIHFGSAAAGSISGTGVPANTYLVSQTSGTPNGAGVYVTNNATTSSTNAIVSTSTTVDVSAASGTIVIGQELVGTSVTTGTYIAALGTGTGGIGTYITTVKQNVASEAMTLVMPTCTYDSVSGAFVIVSSTTGAASTIGFGSGTIAASLLVTSATGAVLSQGAITAVPGTFMANIIGLTQDWASFQTLFDPDAGSGNAQKLLFAAWVNSQNNRYLYLAEDTDITPTESAAATSSLGYILTQANSSGTAPIYEIAGTPSYLGAFLGGSIASLDYDQTNGRATMDFRAQTGVTPSATNALVRTNLLANGYNMYAALATANQRFTFLTQGSLTGPFQWLDSYVNQIQLNNACQLALMTMLTTYRSIPYNPEGYGIIRSAIDDPVAQALNFGTIRQNVPLSAAQASEVNALAGLPVDRVLATRGWYLVIQPATSQVRQARGSPTIILLYMDGQSIQQISLSSVLVQ